MEKQDLITIVESAITANGVNGISGDSLRNVLLEIVDAIYDGNSGGSGGNVVKVWLDSVFSEEELTEERAAANALARTKILNKDYDVVIGVVDIEGYGSISIPMNAFLTLSSEQEGVMDVWFTFSEPMPLGDEVFTYFVSLLSDGTLMAL